MNAKTPAQKPAVSPAAAAKDAAEKRAAAAKEIVAKAPAVAQPTAPTANQPVAPAIPPKLVEQTIKSSAQTYEQAVTATKQQFEKAIPTMMKGYDEFTAINQANVDAFMRASNVLVKGVEDLGKAYFKFAQSSAEASAEAAKSMMTAKTLKEVVDVQSGYARTSFDTLVAESTKLNEMTIKVANETMQPIQTQFNKAIERAMKVSAV